MKYYVSNDFKGSIAVEDKDDAIKVADIISGFVFLVFGDQNLIVYHSKDKKSSTFDVNKPRIQGDVILIGGGQDTQVLVNMHKLASVIGRKSGDKHLAYIILQELGINYDY